MSDEVLKIVAGLFLGLGVPMQVTRIYYKSSKHLLQVDSVMVALGTSILFYLYL